MQFRPATYIIQLWRRHTKACSFVDSFTTKWTYFGTCCSGKWYSGTCHSGTYSSGTGEDELPLELHPHLETSQLIRCASITYIINTLMHYLDIRYCQVNWSVSWLVNQTTIKVAPALCVVVELVVADICTVHSHSLVDTMAIDARVL